MRLIYSLAKSYRERVFIESGEALPEKASVDLDAAALTPALRAHILRTSMGGIGIPESLTLSDFEINRDGVGKPWRGCGITLDAPASDADALRLLAEDVARWEAIEARRQDAATAAQARQEAQRIKDAAEVERTRLDALAAAEARAAREAERATWIAVHGSDYLKRCQVGGYNCQRQYALERAKAERPGYTLDYNDAARWRDRSGPSDAALVEAERVGGFVVWLTAPPSASVARDDDEDGGDYGFEPCEAVVITDFLGQYDLIKQF